LFVHFWNSHVFKIDASNGNELSRFVFPASLPGSTRHVFRQGDHHWFIYDNNTDIYRLDVKGEWAVGRKLGYTECPSFSTYFSCDHDRNLYYVSCTWPHIAPSFRQFVLRTNLQESSSLEIAHRFQGFEWKNVYFYFVESGTVYVVVDKQNIVSGYSIATGEKTFESPVQHAIGKFGGITYKI
jgi:outer membrane protein assembly factor BamB